MSSYVLLLASPPWLQWNYIWICPVVDSKAAEVSWIFPSLIPEHAEDTFLNPNKRIIKSPPFTETVSGCNFVGLRPNVNWGVHHEGGGESCCSTGPTVCQEGALLSGNRWFLLLTGEMSACPPGTQRLWRNWIALPFAPISKSCIKYAALWSQSTKTINKTNNVSAHFLSPVYFYPALLTVFAITTNDLSILVLLTDFFLVHCVQTCWNVKTKQLHKVCNSGIN